MRHLFSFGTAVLAIAATCCLGSTTAGTARAATFDDLALAPESYWNGSDSSGGFTSGDAFFNNQYNTTWKSWDGWAYSNTTDATTPGYGNQYSAIPGGGADGSANYGVAYYSSWASTPPTISFSNAVKPDGCYLTNTTYAYLAMLTGEDCCDPQVVRDKFGWWDKNGDGDYNDSGDYEGNFPDYLYLTIEGKLGGASTGTVVFYLADYQFDTDADDYILDDWTWCDLSGLGAVDSLAFSMTTSDVGGYGPNTPTFFALDNLTVVPEPSTIILLAAGLLAVLARRRRK